jgi:hypothetical protein
MPKHRICVEVDTGAVEAKASAEAVAEAAAQVSAQVKAAVATAVQAALKVKAGAAATPPSVKVSAASVS